MARKRGGKKIDFTAWVFARQAFLAQAAGAAGLTLITSSAGSNTLLRIRGNLLAYVDAAQVPGGLVSIGVGMIVMPEGTGTALTSTPLSDGNAPWLWYESFHLGYEEMVTDVVDIPGITSFRVPIDNKAMRILRPDREIQLVVENATIGTAMAVNVTVEGRFLLGS